MLDEPTSSLDEESEIKVLNQIKKLKENATILIATHDETVKKISDITLKIYNNKIEKL